MASIIKSEKKQPKFRRKTVVLLAIVTFVVIAVGVGCLVVWLNSTNSRHHATISGLPTYQPLTFSQSQVQTLTSQGNYKDAHQTAEAALTTSTDQSQKYGLYMQDATTYENQKDYPNALKQYQNAKAIQNNYIVNFSIGRVEEALGDKQSALASYQQALKLIKPDDFYGFNQQTVEDRIKALGG